MEEHVFVQNGKVIALPEDPSLAECIIKVVMCAAQVGIQDLRLYSRGDYHLFWRIESAAKYRSGWPCSSSCDYAIILFAEWCGIFIGCGGGDGRVGYAQIDPQSFKIPDISFSYNIIRKKGEAAEETVRENSERYNNECCKTCNHRWPDLPVPPNGHCYMFREFPGAGCAQSTARTSSAQQ